MSQENVDRFRGTVEAFNDEDLEAYLAAADSKLLFHPSGVFPSHDSLYLGQENFRAFWATFHNTWERVESTIARLEDIDDRVLALLTFSGVLRETGIRMQRRFASVATFANGLMVELSSYGSWDEGLAAVGLAS
jgi:ketosteroid isomerase-like protein